MEENKNTKYYIYQKQLIKLNRTSVFITLFVISTVDLNKPTYLFYKKLENYNKIKNKKIKIIKEIYKIR
jgi:hypothetical protein